MKKLFTMLVTFLIALVCFSACGKVKHNAEIIDEGITYQTEWLKANTTYGAYSENPDYDPDDPQSEPALVDRSSPKDRTYVIKDKSALDGIFSEFPETDFTKDMVVIYCFTTIYTRERVLERVEVDENNVLIIDFKSKDNDGRGDAHMPGTAVLVIRMDALDITETKITYNGQ